jgi:hypothetical protein
MSTALGMNTMVVMEDTNCKLMLKPESDQYLSDEDTLHMLNISLMRSDFDRGS